MQKCKEVSIDDNPDLPEVPPSKLVKVWLIAMVLLLIAGVIYRV